MTPEPDKGKPEARDGEQEQKEEEKEGTRKRMFNSHTENLKGESDVLSLICHV